MEELKPSFIIYTALLPATPAERLAAAATAFFDRTDDEPMGAWCIVYINVQGLLKFAEKLSIVQNHCHCYAEVSDRGNGPEICIEFYNCEPPTSIDHGDGHGDDAW